MQAERGKDSQLFAGWSSALEEPSSCGTGESTNAEGIWTPLILTVDRREQIQIGPPHAEPLQGAAGTT